MKKSLKALALIAAAGALTFGSAFTASAASVENGQWCDEGSNGWWYKLNADGSKFLANTWYWIKDADGVTRCYYFNYNGWLQTNTTIDGNKIDANGRWVVDGKVQEADSSKDYATCVDFAKIAAENAQKAANNAAPANNTAPAANSTANATVSKNSTKKAYKSKGGGDNPSAGTFDQAYGSSSISGSTAVNTWSNFKITLTVAPTLLKDGAGTDWYYESESGSISCSYRRIDEFTAGNTTLDGFINGYTNSAKGFAKYKVTKKAKASASNKYKIENLGAKTFGNLTFTALRRELPYPTGTKYDYAYLRVVDGTGYVQVIEITGGATYESALATISTAN